MSMNSYKVDIVLSLAKGAFFLAGCFSRIKKPTTDRSARLNNVPGPGGGELSTDGHFCCRVANGRRLCLRFQTFQGRFGSSSIASIATNRRTFTSEGSEWSASSGWSLWPSPRTMDFLPGNSTEFGQPFTRI